MLARTVLSLALIMIACLSHASSHLSETRYSTEIKRHDDGRIVRSVTVIKEFERLYPLPSGYNRSDWQIDHVIPLDRCGADKIHNLQWLPKAIKTCKDDSCKDRFERKGIYPKRC